jgi:hypothetical protein
MSSTRAARPTRRESVPAWPRIGAVVRADATGTITITGTERACAAETTAQLRRGICARCTAVARDLGRPVFLVVTEGDTTMSLVVRPEGIVQPLNDDGTVDEPIDLVPEDSPCRACRHTQPITTSTCPKCAIADPHTVEIAHSTPHPPVDGPSSTTSRLHPPTGGRHDPTTEPGTLYNDAPPVAMRTAVRMTFSSQPPVTVSTGAVLGRDPATVGGRIPVPVKSPDQMMSKTHAFVDVASDGHIVVADNGSQINGTDQDLPAGEPWVVPSGTTLVLGDVLCTLESVTIPFNS